MPADQSVANRMTVTLIPETDSNLAGMMGSPLWGSDLRKSFGRLALHNLNLIEHSAMKYNQVDYLYIFYSPFHKTI
jgi:hypothetical protein